MKSEGEMKTGPKPKPDLERFFNKVNKDGPDHPYDKSIGKCWLWVGAHYPNGYGAFSKSMDGKTINGYAHRFSYEHHKGPILSGEVCHSCDVRDCVNPAHLWIGTRKQNIQDAMKKGRKPPMPTGKKFQKGVCHRRAAGEAHGQSVLTESAVIAIRAHASSESKAAIARLFAVSPSTIGAIRERKTWKHIP